MALVKQPRNTPHANLVFSSVGDRSNVSTWMHGPRNFDLWVTYYGDRPGHLRDIADYYTERKGAKFQNLYFAYQDWPALFQRYTAVLVMDDDLVISASEISRLFDLRERYDLWALQPAFSPRGKISWPLTKVNRRHELRFTSFIEMTCPLFRRDKLDAFMAVYDPELIGWGCDWWFLEAMGEDLRGRVAVIDSITCVNPHDATKGRREIDHLMPAIERKAIWDRLKKKYNIRGEDRGMYEYGAISKPLVRRSLGILASACEQTWIGSAETGRRAMAVLRRLCLP